MFTLPRINKHPGSARQQIAIEGVRDSVLTLTSHEHRLILEVSSVNFELKSEDEQDALIEAYQNFLNALSAPFQCIVRIRELDMDKYVADIQLNLKKEQSQVYKQQLSSYSSFISQLIDQNKILSRQFYIVLAHRSEQIDDFEMIKEQLDLQAEIVSKGLAKLGMSARLLSSLESLDLFYSFYAQQRSKSQPLTDKTLRLVNDLILRTEPHAS